VPGQTDITVDGWSGGGGGGGGSVDPVDLISGDANNATTLGSDGKLFTPKATGGGSVDPVDLISDDADNAIKPGSDGLLFAPKITGWFRMEIRADGHLWFITVDGGTNPFHIDDDGHLILTI